jgi:hypothetical protein
MSGLLSVFLEDAGRRIATNYSPASEHLPRHPESKLSAGLIVNVL